ncbi:MAG TPA: hypothetical protein VF729_09495 [Solirubrobacterales bacterium]
MTARVTALLTVTAIAAVVAGCGGDDEDSPTASADQGRTTPSASEAKFISRVNAICTARKRELLKDLGAYSLAYRERHPNQRAAADAFPGGLRTVGLPGLETLAAELRKIEPPPDDEGRAEAYLDEFEAAIDSAQERKRIDEAQFVKDFEKSRELAREYGIGACAIGG